MRRHGDVLRAVSGYLMLLPLMPLVGAPEVMNPGALVPPFAFSWANLPTSRVGIAYLIVCAFLLFAFARFGAHRRAVVALLVVSAIAWYANAGDLNWLGLVVAVGAVGVVVVAVESWRQNRALLAELRSKRRSVVKTSLRQSVALWSPVVVLIALGLLINAGINRAVTRLLYEMPSVDEYCAINLLNPIATRRHFPCTEFGGVIRPTDQREFELRENVEVQVPESFLRTQQKLLQELESVEDQALAAEDQFIARIQDLTGRMQPTTVLGLPVVGDPFARIDADPELRELRAAAATLEAQLKTAQRFTAAPAKGGFGGLFGGISVVPGGIRELVGWRELHARADAARKAADARIVALRAMSEQEVAAWGPGEELGRQLSMLQPTAAPSFAASGADNRVALQRWTVGSITRFQAQALEAVLSRVGPVGEADAVTEAQLQEPVYAALSLKRLCSLAQERTDPEDEEFTINARPYECWELVAGPNEVTRLGVQESLEQSLDWWQTTQQVKLELKLQDAVQATAAGQQTAQEAGQNLITAVPGTIYLGRGKCKWHNPGTWGTCGANWAKTKAEGAYEKGRRKAGKAADKALNRGVDKAGDATSTEIFNAYENGKVVLQDSTQRLRTAIAKSANGLKLFQYFGNMVLAFAVIKSMLYVLTVTTLTNTPSLLVGLSQPAVRKRGVVVAAGPGTGRTQVLIRQPVVSDTTLTNSVSDPFFLGWPWPFSSPISRLLARKYLLMHHCQPVRSGGAMPVSSNKNIICWTLRPGEEVVFSYRNFYGASPNLKFSSTVSLAVTSLPLGRTVFHIARCEGAKLGHLLLMADSLHYAKQPQGIGVTPDRLIAWNRQAQFQFKKALTQGSMLVGNYTLLHQATGAKGGWVVVSAGGQQSALGGLFRIVLRILF